MKNLNFKKLFLVFFITIFCNIGFAQVSTYTFIDPCTKEVTNFSVPLQGGKTMIIFLNKIGYFDANDLSNGTFTNWVNQVYTVYRQTNPCSQQQGQVIQNQITSQIISGTIQSLVGSILASSQSQSSNTESGSVNTNGGTDAGDKDNKNSEKKKNKSKTDGNNNSSGSSTNSTTNQNGGQSQTNTGTTNQNGGSTPQQGSGTGTNNTTTTGSSNTTTGGSSSTQPPVNTNNGGSSNSGSSSPSSSNSGGSTGKTPPTTNTGGSGSTNNNPPQNKSEEVGTSITMNVDAHNDNGGGDNKGGGGKGNGKANPVIISSDITSAQNLDRTYTPIINIGTSKSSMTGLSSFGVTGMVWLNFNQFAISGRYTKIHYNKSKKLKFIHNLNLTGVYTYGNYLGFVGYSGILNGGKYGVAGFNISAAATVIAMDKSGYYSPSITGFYTRPFKVGKKLIVSPELYIISTPLVYSTKEKVSITDRYVSGFIGSGFDYQISKRFKVNVNYKANLSTNPNFPVLSFFLIGSKVNL